MTLQFYLKNFDLEGGPSAPGFPHSRKINIYRTTAVLCTPFGRKRNIRLD